jgi:transposase
MERRRFTREFKLEAVRLIRDRGVSYARASQDLNVHPTQLRNWAKAFADDRQHAFPGQGQMKPEQLEIARLKREVLKLKAERGILKKAAAYFAKGSTRSSPSLRGTGDLGRGLDVRGARCLAGWVLCLAAAAVQPPRPQR